MKFVLIYRIVMMVDDWYNIMEEENDEVLKVYFIEGLDGFFFKFLKK